MAGEAVAQDGIDAPDVAIPRSFASGTVIYIGEKLLVPTDGGEELRCDFVFCFEVVREGVGVADIWNLKAGEENFTPKLPVAPLVTDVFGESDLVVVADAFARRKGGALFRNRKEVGAVAK